MGTRTILVAIADPQAQADVSQALGTEWMPTPVGTEAEARAQVEKYAFDALLVDFNLGSGDASELLNLTLEKRPETRRFLLAYEADLALVAAKVAGEHQILPKPIEPASLKHRIEEEFAPQAQSAEAAPGAAPKIPPIYSEVIKALESPETTNRQVGDIIAQDEALTTELLRLANATYLGSPRNIADPAEAVGALGLGAVKALVMALRFLAEHSHLRPGYLSFDRIWEHSLEVATIARDLVLFETKDRALATDAFAAGLVHDLGKVVLVTNFDDLYARVNSLARKQPVPVWEVEKEMFGANHGEIGGCLLGMWNLPLAIVDAAALHHDPRSGEYDQFSPLAAVHIANVLEHELRPTNDFRVAPTIDTHFLNQLGLLQRLPVWRAAFANGSTSDTEPAFEPTETSGTGSTASELSTTPSSDELAEPVAATRTATSGRPRADASKAPASGNRRMGWVYAGLAAALVVLAALWFGARSAPQPSLPVHARTPVAAPVATAALPETAPAAAAPAKPTVTTTEAPPTTIATAPAMPKPAPVAAPASAPQASITQVPSPAAGSTPQAAVLPGFKLNGVIYSVTRPAAIVNGQTVYVGSHVNGATVLGIGQNQVTLEINGQRQILQLR